jgi:hypothetical protein
MARRHIINEADTGIVRFGRAEFFDEVFDYQPGQHCTFLAPFGGGKTQVAFEALARAASPELKATIFAMKPKDKTVTQFAKAQELEIIRDWPPPTISIGRRIVGKKTAGYVLWPKDTGNLEFDEMNQERIFRRAIQDMYVKAKKHPNIMFADETYSLEKELHLQKELGRAWTKGRSVGNGLWAASQRPAFISQWAYQAQHLFLGYDADERAQDRYSEIGAGNNPAVIKALINGLQQYEFLYIHREERSMCIIEAN